MLLTWLESLKKWCRGASENNTPVNSQCASPLPKSRVFLAHPLSRKQDLFVVTNTKPFLSTLRGQPVFYSLEDCHDYARFRTSLFCCLEIKVGQHAIISDSKQLILHSKDCTCLSLTGLYRGWDETPVKLLPPSLSV